MVMATQTISRLCKWPLGGKTLSAESSLSADTQPSRVADSKWKLNFGLQQPLLETEAPETGSHALKLLIPLPPSDLKQSDIRKGLWTTHLLWQILCQSLISFDCFILTCVLMYTSVSLFDTKHAPWRHLCFFMYDTHLQCGRHSVTDCSTVTLCSLYCFRAQTLPEKSFPGIVSVLHSPWSEFWGRKFSHVLIIPTYSAPWQFFWPR